MTNDAPRFSPDTTIHHVTIPCYEGQPGGEDTIYGPPGQVVEVCVVGEHTFLSLCTYDEDAKVTTTTKVAEIHVDTMALVRALQAQMHEATFALHPVSVR